MICSQDPGWLGSLGHVWMQIQWSSTTRWIFLSWKLQGLDTGKCIAYKISSEVSLEAFGNWWEKESELCPQAILKQITEWLTFVLKSEKHAVNPDSYLGRSSIQQSPFRVCDATSSKMWWINYCGNNGIYPSSSFPKIYIYFRGKVRRIKSKVIATLWWPSLKQVPSMTKFGWEESAQFLLFLLVYMKGTNLFAVSTCLGEALRTSFYSVLLWRSLEQYRSSDSSSKPLEAVMDTRYMCDAGRPHTWWY